MSAPAIPTLPAELRAEVVGAAERVGSELRCRVRLGDGRDAVLAWLAPELAREAAMRRRYVRDVARLRELDAPGVAPVLAAGPEEPRAPGRRRRGGCGSTRAARRSSSGCGGGRRRRSTRWWGWRSRCASCWPGCTRGAW
ncbi:hypothetical protein [Nannocystis pusilla]|uniref:hypothetical protein n=1 Tax=Nannocystis pusilla TaxID=889268 RepID=UPI003B810875